MIDQQLANTSDALSWVALVVYAVAALLSFGFLAYRAKRAGTAGVVLAWAGVAIHLAAIVTRGLAAGRVPWGNMYEYSSMLALLLVAGQLVLGDLRKGTRSLTGFVLAVAVLTLGIARTFYVPTRELQPALGGLWLKVHVFAAIVGTMMFTLSFVYSVLFLVRRRAELRAEPVGSTVGAAHVDVFEEAPANAGPGTVRGIAGRLPSAERLDDLAHGAVKLGFPVWTFAVIAGAIWAHEAWSRYWGWDPKETWAFATWIAYAGYLHARATAGWRERKAAVLNVVAFAVVLFTYYGVNLWLPGLHSYANG